MRTLSGTMGASVHAQNALPSTYQAAYLRNVVEYASIVGAEPSSILAMDERASEARVRLLVQCSTEGHMRRPWYILGDPSDRRDVCVRCGERL